MVFRAHLFFQDFAVTFVFGDSFSLFATRPSLFANTLSMSPFLIVPDTRLWPYNRVSSTRLWHSTARPTLAA